jgi:hypothetical protein
MVGGLRERKLSVMHMGMNSAPVSELCCAAPFLLCKNKPKKFIVTMMGANDLVWYPAIVCMPCIKDYPSPCYNSFMGHVKRCASPGLKVIYVPDQVGLRSYYDTKTDKGCLRCHKTYYDRVKDSAATVLTVGSETTDLKDPGWTYTRTTNASAQHTNLIYIDAYAVYDKLIEANGKKWAGGMEASLQVYLHHNAWVLEAMTEGEMSAPSSVSAPSSDAMERRAV